MIRRRTAEQLVTIFSAISLGWTISDVMHGADFAKHAPMMALWTLAIVAMMADKTFRTFWFNVGKPLAKPFIKKRKPVSRAAKKAQSS